MIHTLDNVDTSKWTVHADRTMVYVISWHQAWTVQLVYWLAARFNFLKVRPVRVPGVVAARNTAIYLFLNSPGKFTHALFVDDDVRPCKQSDEILKLDRDIKCCQVREENPNAWDSDEAFHDNFWATSRSVLEKIPAPHFIWPLIPAGTRYDQCPCVHFAKKAAAMGFTMGHAGTADHDARNSWCGNRVETGGA